MAGTHSTKPLPCYIVERNKRAIDAGLKIEKQKLSGDKLSTVYSGLPDQFVAAGFLLDPKKFLAAVAAPTKQIYHGAGRALIFSPLESYFSPNFYRTGTSELRLIITRELMPTKQWLPAPGVEAYETFHTHELDGLCHVYIAKTFKALEAINLDANFFDNESEDEDERHGRIGDATLRLWWWGRDKTLGIIRLHYYPENSALIKEADNDDRRSLHESPEDFRSSLLKSVGISDNLLCCETTTAAGFHYALPDDARGDIQDLLSQIKGVIKHSPMRVSKAKPRSEAWNTIMERHRKHSARMKQIDAKYDSNFQGFMGKTLSAVLAK